MNDTGQGVTVVVPTLNRGTYLLDTVRDLLAQEHRPLEILVVDQSTEGTEKMEALAAAHSDIISYRRVSFRGLPQARNFGWQNSRYEAILYVDDDIRCGPELVSEHLRALRLPGVGIAGGCIDESRAANESKGRPGRFNFWTASPVNSFNSTKECEASHVPGGNFSCWRSVLRECGGVDESLSIGASLYEETDLSLRARQRGYKIYFNGRARLLHLAAGSGGCREKNMTNYVRALSHNRAILIRRFLLWYQAPVAVARLSLLCLAYSFHYRQVNAIGAGVSGFFSGLRDGGRAPLCGDYSREVRA
jgi:GT2 family glycosyltransferase